MKLATFDAGAGPEVGAVVDGWVVPLSRALPIAAPDMQTVIRHWPAAREELRGVAARAQGRLALSEVRLLAPLSRPGKIWAIGLNYADHVAESGATRPERPIWFSKAATAASGPFDAIDVTTANVDYEVELVAVIGVGGRRIAREAAPEAVFGWCVGNDVSERAWQHATSQWSLGKSFDTHAPFGPWITTVDEIADPHALDLSLTVNGEPRQRSNTQNLVFDVWSQIESLSSALTLEPGDLIFTGTPGGVGAALTPPRFLGAGDVVRAEIAGLGAIENRCERLAI